MLVPTNHKRYGFFPTSVVSVLLPERLAANEPLCPFGPRSQAGVSKDSSADSPRPFGHLVVSLLRSGLALLLSASSECMQFLIRLLYISQAGLQEFFYKLQRYFCDDCIMDKIAHKKGQIRRKTENNPNSVENVPSIKYSVWEDKTRRERRGDNDPVPEEYL